MFFKNSNKKPFEGFQCFSACQLGDSPIRATEKIVSNTESSLITSSSSLGNIGQASQKTCESSGYLQLPTFTNKNKCLSNSTSLKYDKDNDIQMTDDSSNDSSQKYYKNNEGIPDCN